MCGNVGDRATLWPSSRLKMFACLGSIKAFNFAGTSSRWFILNYRIRSRPAGYIVWFFVGSAYRYFSNVWSVLLSIMKLVGLGPRSGTDRGLARRPRPAVISARGHSMLTCGFTAQMGFWNEPQIEGLCLLQGMSSQSCPALTRFAHFRFSFDATVRLAERVAWKIAIFMSHSDITVYPRAISNITAAAPYYIRGYGSTINSCTKNVTSWKSSCENYNQIWSDEISYASAKMFQYNSE